MGRGFRGPKEDPVTDLGPIVLEKRTKKAQQKSSQGVACEKREAPPNSLNAEDLYLTQGMRLY